MLSSIKNAPRWWRIWALRSMIQTNKDASLGIYSWGLFSSTLKACLWESYRIFSVRNSRRQSHTEKVLVTGQISTENKDKLPSHGILELFKLELVKSPLLKVFWQKWPFSTVVIWQFLCWWQFLRWMEFGLNESYDFF